VALGHFLFTKIMKTEVAGNSGTLFTTNFLQPAVWFPEAYLGKKGPGLALGFNRIVLASSRVYSRKICHWVVPNQKTGSLFRSAKYLPFSLILTGKTGC
jgi:hypothetical protein